MKPKNTLAIIVLALLSTGLLSALGGCYGIPKGTTEESMVGQLQLKATGAGIVKANAQKTTYRIKCTVCSFENNDKTILTPTVDDPYVLDWLCPNCGHRQIIMIQAFEKQSP